MTKCDNVIIFTACFLSSFIHSAISSILVWDSPDRFIRNAIHIPWGVTGIFICKFNINYGFIYFIMICLYQIMEQIEHLFLKSTDRSWYDIEGYILGLSYTVWYLSIVSYRNNRVVTELSYNNL